MDEQSQTSRPDSWDWILIALMLVAAGISIRASIMQQSEPWAIALVFFGACAAGLESRWTKGWISIGLFALAIIFFVNAASSLALRMALLSR